jgi:hypothetical protein
VGARILLNLGADSERVRNAVVESLGKEVPRPLAVLPSEIEGLQRHAAAYGRIIGWLLFAVALGIGILLGWLIWG